MTAHMVFEAIDPTAPATCSATMIRDIVRGAIGFGGLLLSDDLSMQALDGSLGSAPPGRSPPLRYRPPLQRQVRRDARVAAASPALEGEAAARASAALAHIKPPQPYDRERAVALCEALTGERALVA